MNFKNVGLQKKLIIQTVLTCILFGAVIAYAVMSFKGVSSAYRNVSLEQFPKVESAAKLVARFRLIRIKVRSLAVLGNTQAVQEKYIDETKQAIGSFLEEKKKFDSFNFSLKEKQMVEELNKSWDEFLAFGVDLLSNYENPTEESQIRGAAMIRDICPVKAKAWMSVAENFVKLQSAETVEAVNTSQDKEQRILMIVTSVVIVAVFVSLFQGFLFSRKLSNKIEKLSQKLLDNAIEVGGTSDTLLTSSVQLSDAASESTISLQETVSSIDEISSMIQRNAESADTSTKVSAKSSDVARKGKDTVEQMIGSIAEISDSNDAIAEEMQKNSKDISKIVQVITEIGEKTKVINDIVFQTKLLSFNASVEAARAGEHGKGFAVVAEEVGNLATMSGNAALEITEMLESSITSVNEIVEASKVKVEALVNASKEKVKAGTQTAHFCGEVLDEILQNVTSVNELVNEIASASNEQSLGVQEVTKAMQQLDQTTHQNTSIAKTSSTMATRLKNQALGLNQAVDELLGVVTGGDRNQRQNHHEVNNTLELKSSKSNVEQEYDDNIIKFVDL